MYDIVLLDADMTIWDFEASEKLALADTVESVGGVMTEEAFAFYSRTEDSAVTMHINILVKENEWNLISVGNERSVGQNYSMSKGLIGGLFGLGTASGFSHSKGSSKGEYTEIYQCPHCGKTVPIKVSTFW